MRYKAKFGFTLIELSIVLVIIGFIVGSILTGQDLINAAAQRAQISQIEKYQTATRTFYNKYSNQLPGDIPAPYATNFGFVARGAYQGQGDGNGILQGVWANAANSAYGEEQAMGENEVFWVDLSTAGLIDGGFSSGSMTVWTSCTTDTCVSNNLPRAKLGNGNYLYVYSTGGAPMVGFNYFGILAVNNIGNTNAGMAGNLAVTVQQAYNIDKKIDDGLPQSGSVLAVYVSSINGDASWAGTGNNVTSTYTTATPYASTNCFDNNNIAGPQQYSITKNSSSQNCALSFRFQ